MPLSSAYPISVAAVVAHVFGRSSCQCQCLQNGERKKETTAASLQSIVIYPHSVVYAINPADNQHPHSQTHYLVTFC